jgi:NitT/TauT family transport system ATP-binding protein
MTLPDTHTRTIRHADDLPTAIELDGVRFAYDAARPIVDDFSWRVSEGESWSILGPSGSGKTTLLYLMAGLRKPQTGRVLLNGELVRGPSHDVGLMLQDYGLLPWLTAERNVQLGLKIRNFPRRDRHRIRAAWLERMQIAHVAKRYPGQLSGGQRQRVALARVLALETNVLLLDEPLSAVDELTRERLQKTLRAIRMELGVTMVMVTHSVEEAALLTDNVLIFPGDGALSDPFMLRSPFAGVDTANLPQRDSREFLTFTGEIREALGL